MTSKKWFNNQIQISTENQEMLVETLDVEKNRSADSSDSSAEKELYKPIKNTDLQKEKQPQLLKVEIIKKEKIKLETKEDVKAVKQSLNNPMSHINRAKVTPGEKKNWLARVWGVVLGVLLALLALPLLFIIVCILFDGDAEGIFEIGESVNDTPFQRGFKRAFNGVVKYGLFVLFILLMTFVLVAILIGLYISFGLLGVILSILIFVLLFYLLFKLMSGFLEFILPDY
jgi:hypothetical protein